MDSFLLFTICCIIIILHINLSSRLKKCEQALKKLKTKTNTSYRQESFPPPPSLSSSLKTSQKATSPLSVKPAAKPAAKVVKPRYSPIKERTPRKPFKIPSILQENWMGIFGSIALVIGAAFFGLTSEIMQHAEVRVSMMIAVSCLFLGISQKLKSHKNWASLCSWLKSIAGTVILCATLGGGGIEGLQFIHSPLYALCFLCLGISVNILLAMTTPLQGIASLHVILSIMTFCMIPQAPILLPLGAIIAGVGLTTAYRSKWDLHLLLIVIAFAVQNTLWTLSLSSQHLPWMHDLAIGSSLIVGFIAACIHYSKKYQSPKLAILPLIAHITNWGLLTWNIWLHAQFSKWSPLLLGALAIAGFIFASIAKRKKIYWLHYTDTLLSQLLAMVAIVSMSSFSIKPSDLGLLILFETLAFSYICRFQKNDFLFRVGCLLQYITCLVIMNDILKELSSLSFTGSLSIYLRIALVTVLSWGFHLTGSLKNSMIDDFRFIIFGQKDLKNPISIMALIGTAFLIWIYYLGLDSLCIQASIVSLIGVLAVWRKLKEDSSWNVALIFSLALIHIITWKLLTALLQQASIPSILSRVDFLGVLILDAILIFGNFLQLKQWKSDLHNFVVYALGIQAGLLTYVFTKEISPLIPGLAFLGFSVLALEIGRTASSLLKYSDEVTLKIKESMVHVGLIFLMAFISQFITVHLQIDPIWHGLSLRWLTEALGLLTLFYWLLFSPQEKTSSKFTQFCGHRLLEASLGFMTLSVTVEMSEMYRPLIWVAIAIGLLLGTLNNRWPKRLLVYSWMYLMASIIHVAFITSSLTMPRLFLLEQHNMPALMAIALQLCYACLTHRLAESLTKDADSFAIGEITRFIPTIYRERSLSVLLPIFLGIALLFAFNFEKAVLTLLWVGLTCIYLALGLFMKSKKSIHIAMAALIFCSIRLIIFDLVQSNPATRALVFIGVGSLMLGISVLYKKYKHRIEVHESI